MTMEKQIQSRCQMYKPTKMGDGILLCCSLQEEWQEWFIYLTRDDTVEITEAFVSLFLFNGKRSWRVSTMLSELGCVWRQVEMQR